MLRANAIYEGTYLMGTSIARPLIAKKQIEIAHREKADAGVPRRHGQGQRPGPLRADLLALDPDIRIIAAWRDDKWTFTSREDMINYAAKHNIPLPVPRTSPTARDRNSLHISHEGGILEDPWNEPTEDIFTITVSPEKAPDRPTMWRSTSRRGIPWRLTERR
jgi:argininosuccinate synthase